MNKERTTMLGKEVRFQNPNTVEDSGEGKIMDKTTAKYMNFYLIRDRDSNIRSIPCHWVEKILKD